MSTTPITMLLEVDTSFRSRCCRLAGHGLHNSRKNKKFEKFALRTEKQGLSMSLLDTKQNHTCMWLTFSNVTFKIRGSQNINQ